MKKYGKVLKENEETYKEGGKIPVQFWVTWSLAWIVATIIEEDINLEEVILNS